MNKSRSLKVLKVLKVLGVLLCAAALSACAASPQQAIEQTIVQSQLDPSVFLERMTASDDQGTSSVLLTMKDGKIVDLTQVNEASTSEQDNLQTFIGTATAPLINVGGALLLQENAPDCGGDGCGGGGQQVMQLQLETNSTSTAGSSQSGGCTTCALLD
jgi:hypothetical protein